MVEYERLGVTEDVALSPVFAGFAKLRARRLIGVRSTIRNATIAESEDLLKKPHCY